MKKALIVLVAQPLNKFNYYKWSFNKKYNSKWNIKFWNILNLENKHLNEKFSGKGHGIVKNKNFINIKNISHLIKEFAKLPKNFFYINLSVLKFKCSLIDKLLDLKGGTCVNFKMNKLPGAKVTTSQRIKLVLRSPYKLLYLKKILNYFFSKLINYFQSNFLLGKPKIYIVPNINIIKTHSYDYELFMNNHKSKIKNKNYAVFIDEDIDNHFEYALINKGKKFFWPSHWYWKKIEKFLSFVESQFGLKIIIAAHHRRSKYDLPIKRKFVFNKTLDLVKNSKLVIMHNSTTVHQGILCKKPIILLKLNVHNEKMTTNLTISMFAKMTGAKVINLETFPYSKKNFNTNYYLKINNKKYKKYTDNYIKPPNTGNIPVWKTVLGELDKFNFQNV